MCENDQLITTQFGRIFIRSNEMKQIKDLGFTLNAVVLRIEATTLVSLKGCGRTAIQQVY